MARGIIDRHGMHGTAQNRGIASAPEASAPAADRQGNAGATSGCPCICVLAWSLRFLKNEGSFYANGGIARHYGSAAVVCIDFRLRSLGRPRPAVTPGHLMAALADRHRLPVLDRRLAATLATAFAGGVLGAGLLLTTPERIFAALVPALIALATLVFALGKRLRTALAQWAGPGGEKLRTALLLPTSAYGGYFGAGLGVMLLALLMISSHNEIRASNALKNLLATIISLATLMIFAVQGVIRWPETLVMLAGALCGGMLGGRLIAILRPDRVRAIVIAIGIVVSTVYAWRYWV